MLLTLVAGLALLQQPGRPDTDTTVALRGASRLVMSVLSAEVQVRAWDRNEVRIRAWHSSRARVAARADGAVLRVEVESRMGMPAVADFELTVPAGMAAELDGMNLDVDIAGLRGALKVTSVNGDLRIRDAGDLELSAINGEIVIEGGRGRARLAATSGGITVNGWDGELVASAISGGIALQRITSSRVEAETVSGSVQYDGTVADGGTYLLAAHSGGIIFAVPERANATISSVTRTGSLGASFTLPAVEERSRTRRQVRFGTGSARVELESFSGGIRLVRPGQIEFRSPRSDRRERDRAHLEHLDFDFEFDLDDFGGLPALAGLASLATLRLDLVPELLEGLSPLVSLPRPRDLPGAARSDPRFRRELPRVRIAIPHLPDTEER